MTLYYLFEITYQNFNLLHRFKLNFIYILFYKTCVNIFFVCVRTTLVKKVLCMRAISFFTIIHSFALLWNMWNALCMYLDTFVIIVIEVLVNLNFLNFFMKFSLIPV